MINHQEIIALFATKGIKITPQRIAVFDIISCLDHPYADEILSELKKNNPSIAKGTVYSILDHFYRKEIIAKVKTSNGKLRYDPIIKPHHHIVNENADEIIDFTSEKLNSILQGYFTENPIPGFVIEDLRLQIHVTKSTNT
jgi:Fur family peroxide stress response transcriptional regulator